jgi:hypothetical protein
MQPQPDQSIVSFESGATAVIGFDADDHVVDNRILFHGKYTNDPIKHQGKYYIIRDVSVVKLDGLWWWYVAVEDYTLVNKFMEEIWEKFEEAIVREVEQFAINLDDMETKKCYSEIEDLIYEPCNPDSGYSAQEIPACIALYAAIIYHKELQQ